MTLKLVRCLEMNLHHAGTLPLVASQTMLLENFAADARRAWLDYQAIHNKTADDLLCRWCLPLRKRQETKRLPDENDV